MKLKSLAFIVVLSIAVSGADIKAQTTDTWASIIHIQDQVQVLSQQIFEMMTQGGAGASQGKTGGKTPDTTLPVVSLSSPADGSLLSKTISIAAVASDNVGVSKVEFYVDNILRGTDTRSPYLYSWNTTTATNANHTLIAKAYDTAKNIGISATITVTVDNTTQDTTPPTVPTNLTATAVSSTQINLSWTASTDNVAVIGYNILRNGTKIGSTANNTYSNTGLSESTSYTYTVSAFDAVGNTSAVSVSAIAKTFASGNLVLNDPELSTLVNNLDSDGSISRRDMIQILISTGSDDGVVDAVELGDLKTILSKASTLGIPSYVQVLANDVVNGNLANNHYQGQVLGNLAVGSSADQLTKLVNKWFYGSDHPAAGTFSYRSVAGSLFVNGPSYTDMYQGNLSDCYFIAALGSIAKSSSIAVQNMFMDNGDNTWTVRFYYNGTADYVTVDRFLPTDSYGYLVFANATDSYAWSTNELWMPLVEKAYAQWNETGKEGRDGTNNYYSIANGWMSDVDAQVLGSSAQSYFGFADSHKTVLVSGTSANKAVTIATNGAPGSGLFGSHVYVVIGYNSTTDTFTLSNPFGSSNPGPLSWAQLKAGCTGFVVADTSGTTPFGS